MDSDRDMFSSQPDLGEKEEEEIIRRSASCPGKMPVSYGFLILFNWDEGVKKPFKIFPRKTFSPQDIRDHTIESNLRDEFRIRALKPLKALPGIKMSFFAKVEACEYFTTDLFGKIF